jgi:lysophospholipase L1-like esterase
MSRRVTTIVAGCSLAFATAVALPQTPAEASPPKLSMLALGDSYSAGVGLGHVYRGCDRNKGAYARRAANKLADKYKVSILSKACSGAVVGDVLDKQLRHVTSDRNIVTITIGGNDIHFEEKLKGCALGTCGGDVFGIKPDKRGGKQTWSELSRRLVTTYVNVRKRMAKSGYLYVSTYPMPFARTTQKRCAGLDPIEQSAANALVTALDDVIEEAVAKANQALVANHGRPGNIRLVEWRTPKDGREVDGYAIPANRKGAGLRFDTWKSPDGLCNGRGRTPFIRGYGPSTSDRTRDIYDNSFHPNSTGYGHMATKVANAIRADFPLSKPINAYSNWGTATGSLKMCRGNPSDAGTSPGGLAEQAFILPPGVARITGVRLHVAADPNLRVTVTVAHHFDSRSITVTPTGDMTVKFPTSLPTAGGGSTFVLRVRFSAVAGDVPSTIYTAGPPGPDAVLFVTNDCTDEPHASIPDGTTALALRAIVYGKT